MYRDEREVAVTTVRALNAYGPGQVPATPYGPSKVRKIMPAFVCRALAKEPIEVYGDGEQVMDMIYVEDVAAILVRALETTMAEGALPHTVEAGTGRTTSVKFIADLVNAATDNPAPIKYLPMRPGEPPQSIVLGDPNTLEHIYYAGDLVSLEEGIGRTVEWYREEWLGA
jgi:UDP-glucose 4-epimerase